MNESEVTKVNLPKFPTPELIVLTIDEAKFISQILPMSILWTLSLEQYEVIKELNDKIKERIKQAEGK